ncbi:MAG: RNase P subunit p30 family protein [Candidatus Hodarchaeota archaeon]
MSPVDLHVRLSHPNNDAESSAILEQARRLGLTGLGIESPQPLPARLIPRNMELLYRITLNPHSAARLRHRVEKQKQQTDLVVVQGRTKPIALSAAKIPEVDMVLMKTVEDYTIVDSQVARAMTKHNKPVELCLHGLLALKGSARSRLMRVMAQAMESLLRAQSPLVLTSGAENLWQLRTPRDLGALAYLANIPEATANRAVLETSIEFFTRRKP